MDNGIEDLVQEEIQVKAREVAIATPCYVQLLTKEPLHW